MRLQKREKCAKLLLDFLWRLPYDVCICPPKLLNNHFKDQDSYPCFLSHFVNERGGGGRQQNGILRSVSFFARSLLLLLHKKNLSLLLLPFLAATFTLTEKSIFSRIFLSELLPFLWEKYCKCRAARVPHPKELPEDFFSGIYRESILVFLNRLAWPLVTLVLHNKFMCCIVGTVYIGTMLPVRKQHFKGIFVLFCLWSSIGSATSQWEKEEETLSKSSQCHLLWIGYNFIT